MAWHALLRQGKGRQGKARQSRATYVGGSVPLLARPLGGAAWQYLHTAKGPSKRRQNPIRSDYRWPSPFGPTT